jgi:hypothetical protein
MRAADAPGIISVRARAGKAIAGKYRHLDTNFVPGHPFYSP